MPTVLVTGSSRGLGLEFARAYAADGWRVVATCRRPAEASNLRRVQGDIPVHALDLSQPQQIEALAAGLASVPIDVLINNAGVHGPRDASGSFCNLDVAAWLEVMRVNVMAPLKVTEAL